LKGENGCAGPNNSYDIKLLIFEKWFKGAKSGTVPLGPQFFAKSSFKKVGFKCHFDTHVKF